MFRQTIALTPLTTDAANSYFSNITGDKWDNDNSFLATLRALVAPRIREEDSIRLKFGRTNYDKSTVVGNNAREVVSAICRNYNLTDSNGLVVIHSFYNDHDSNMANFDVINSTFASMYEGYHRLDKVKEFYRKSFCVECYINPEKKNAILFVDCLDRKKLHYLQVSILAFLPWYFKPEEGLSELEMELIYSLRETTSEKYEACLLRVAEQYDFRTARIRQLLSGFETRYEKLECDRVAASISDYDDNINHLNNEIGNLLHRRNEACIRLLGLERKIAEGGEDSEIMEYFLCNNRLVLENVTDTDMYFAVKDYLTYFDSEMAERAINNMRSFVYDGGSRHGTSAEKMKKLMTEIFVKENPRLRIKVCAAYRFALEGNVSPCGHHDFSFEFADCIPNTHIDAFNCMGNYSRTINNLLMDRNYIGAIEQCIASCKSLNWGDSPVMGEFMRAMWGTNGYNNRCIELPDGRIVKPAEAIEWLELQETENGQETEEA